MSKIKYAKINKIINMFQVNFKKIKFNKNKKIII